MYRTRLTVESPVSAGGATVIAVARVSGWCSHGDSGFSCVGAKYAAGVIVITRSAKKAFRATGEEVSVERLVSESPGLTEVLAGYP